MDRSNHSIPQEHDEYIVLLKKKILDLILILIRIIYHIYLIFIR